MEQIRVSKAFSFSYRLDPFKRLSRICKKGYYNLTYFIRSGIGIYSKLYTILRKQLILLRSCLVTLIHVITTEYITEGLLTTLLPLVSKYPSNSKPTLRFIIRKK